MPAPELLHKLQFSSAPGIANIEYLEQSQESQRNFLKTWKQQIWTEEDFLRIVAAPEWALPRAELLLQMGAWAIISDVVRLYALYQFGGLYVDWDVELLCPLPAYMLTGQSVVGFEPYTYAGRGTAQVGAQLLISKAQQLLWKRCYQQMQQRIWTKKFTILPTTLTRVLEEHYGLPTPRNKHNYYYVTQKPLISGKFLRTAAKQELVAVYPHEVFYPNTGRIPGTSPITRYTVGIHWEHSQRAKTAGKNWPQYLTALQQC